MTRIDESVAHATGLLASADLADPAAVRELIELTTLRRSLDLSDLPPAGQAALIAERSRELQPSADALRARIEEAASRGRPFVAKFGIDPTGSDVHLGHVVPMLLLSRFLRMGHQVVFIVGDVTAKIGDPSGRSDERPALTDEEIARNLGTYRQQVAPFFDFTRAQFRFNGEWLREVTLPRIVEIAARIPVSMSLQRDDFRKRLDAGHGLSLAEVLYSVVMALDSVEIDTDVEIGGLDQFLNMQMCRKVMEICGQTPELVVATELIEGTDGTGAKMSKSRGNYVPLTAAPFEIVGKLMSIPDRLVLPYFRALTEWRDAELAVVEERLSAGTLHPRDLKMVLACDVAAAIHGVDAALGAREAFFAHFSRRSFSTLESLPEVRDATLAVGAAVRELGFAASAGEVRRLAEGRGVRIVLEDGDEQEQAIVEVDELRQPLSEVVRARFGGRDGSYFLKVGRKLGQIRL